MALPPCQATSPRAREHESHEVSLGGNCPLLKRAETGSKHGSDPPQQSRRVPATEIMRILQEGKLGKFQRASPSLAALCIFPEFAAGLQRIASNYNECLDGNSQAEEVAPDPGNEGRGNTETRLQVGLTRDEFCEYLEAVTDLVELNNMSLVTQTSCERAK